MATVGQHVQSATAELVVLRAAVLALTAELALVRAELEAINSKTPGLINGRMPALVTANGSMPVAVDGPVQVNSTQLPTNLSNGRLRTTDGLL